jgi:hypothetical protein
VSRVLLDTSVLIDTSVPADVEAAISVVSLNARGVRSGSA